MRRLFLLVFIALSCLSACDQNAAPEQTPPLAANTPAASGTTPQAQASTAVPPAPTTKPVPQVLRLHITAEPDVIDPQRAESADEIDVVLKVFSNLLAFDASGRLVPEMAAALPAPSADGLTYTVKLKPNLRYSDGQPLTAKNFEYGWKRQLDPELASSNAFTGFVLAGAEAYASAQPKKLTSADLARLRDAVGVHALDDLTLEFNLTAPAAYFPAILATWNGLPVRQDIVEKAGDKWTEPATYIGNGPYVLKEWQRQARLVFTPNENYWRGKPPLERIDLVLNNTQAGLLAYLNDELDTAILGPTELARVQADPKLSAQLQSRPTGCTSYYGFNTTKPPFDNVKVRRAVAQAFDRAQYVKTFGTGLSLPADQFVPPGLPGNYPGLNTLKFDPTAARKDLADAGFPGGKALPEIRYGYVAGGRNQARADWLATQLKTNLGIELRLDPQDAVTYRDNGKKQSTTPQLFLYAWCQDYPDPQDWYSIVFSSQNSLPYRTGWKSDRYDQLVSAADRELDPQKRGDQYKAAAQLLLDESPAAFVDYGVRFLLVKPYLSGVKVTPLDYIFSGTTLMDLKVQPH